MRIISRFVLPAVLASANGLSVLIFLPRLEAKFLFLGKLAEHSFEVQQIRRFEENYLGYGTILQDARENVLAARDHLFKNSNDVQRVPGQQAFRSRKDGLDYQAAEN